MTRATVAVIGTGVIGRAWVACFLGKGLDVVAHDPQPGAEKATRAWVDAEWPTVQALGCRDGASPSRLRFVDSVAECVSDAAFVQENGPEAIDLKAGLIAETDRHARAGVVIASSSSGLGPSQLRARCDRHPERVLVGHPFHPAHLVPLVEVVAGPGTSEDAADSAMTFYGSLGKHPILVRAELPGHVANRLQAAIWQEAYSLVSRGVVTVAEVDAAIAHGPGLRWALAGPILNQHLSGGDGGLARTLAHLGPAGEEWMADLRPAPLDATLVDKLVRGVREEIGTRDEERISAERDTALLALLALKRDAPSLP